MLLFLIFIFVHHLQNHLNLHYHQVVHPYAAVLQHYVIVVVLLPLLPLVYHTNHHLLYPLVHHVLRQSPHLIALVAAFTRALQVIYHLSQNLHLVLPLQQDAVYIAVVVVFSSSSSMSTSTSSSQNTSSPLSTSFSSLKS